MKRLLAITLASVLLLCGCTKTDTVEKEKEPTPVEYEYLEYLPELSRDALIARSGKKLATDAEKQDFKQSLNNLCAVNSIAETEYGFCVATVIEPYNIEWTESMALNEYLDHIRTDQPDTDFFTDSVLYDVSCMADHDSVIVRAYVDYSNGVISYTDYEFCDNRYLPTQSFTDVQVSVSEVCYGDIGKGRIVLRQPFGEVVRDGKTEYVGTPLEAGEYYLTLKKIKADSAAATEEGTPCYLLCGRYIAVNEIENGFTGPGYTCGTLDAGESLWQDICVRCIDKEQTVNVDDLIMQTVSQNKVTAEFFVKNNVDAKACNDIIRRCEASLNLYYKTQNTDALINALTYEQHQNIITLDKIYNTTD